MSKDAYTLTSPDGKSMELPIRKGSTGPDVIEIGRLFAEQGVFTYDPGFVSTGSCDSEITFIDGNEGVLMYRGYPVEQLAEHSNFIEVAYLLLYGDLPTAKELDEFNTSKMCPCGQSELCDIDTSEGARLRCHKATGPESCCVLDAIGQSNMERDILAAANICHCGACAFQKKNRPPWLCRLDD